MGISKITTSLRDTVAGKANIEKVYFTENGTHYLVVHPHGKELYGRIHRETVLKDGKKVVIVAPMLHTRIVETIDRAKLLKMDAVDNTKNKKVLNLRALSPEMANEVLAVLNNTSKGSKKEKKEDA